MSSSRSLADDLSQRLGATRVLLEARIRELDAEVVSLREARLRELEQKEILADRLQRLLNALPAAVIVIDGRGMVRESNPAARALLGEPLDGAAWRDVIARAFRPDYSRTDLLLHDGRLVTLQTCPLGQEPGQILLLQEVTDARRLQAHLDQSRRLADMGRMAANLAHQIRTPLASALLYVSQLNRAGLGDEKRREFVAKAHERLRDLERLITDMLAFSRGEIGDGEVIVLATLAAAACEVHSETLKARGITLGINDSSAAGTVRGNATLLKTALQNLIQNALQSLPSGGAIHIRTVPAGADAIEIVVEDSGPGVPEALRARLFEPFASGRNDGNGLGLAVVRAVARAHGGEAWFQPRPEGGSRFGLRLPLAVAPMSRAAAG